MRRSGLRATAVVGAVAMLLGACGDALSPAEDDWCAAHPVDGDVEYRDGTWKDACRRAYAGR